MRDDKQYIIYAKLLRKLLLQMFDLRNLRAYLQNELHFEIERIFGSNYFPEENNIYQQKNTFTIRKK